MRLRVGFAALTVAASAAVASVLPALPAAAEPVRPPAPVYAFQDPSDEVRVRHWVDIRVFVGTEDSPATGNVALYVGGNWTYSDSLVNGWAGLRYWAGGYDWSYFDQHRLVDLEVRYTGDATATGDANWAAASTLLPTRVISEDLRYQWVQRLFLDLLDRRGDGPGWTYWQGQFDAGVERHVIGYAMLFSEEYAYNRIADEYWRFFDRDPDEEGGAYYAGKVQQGMPLEYLSVDLVDSEEFYANAGGTDEGFVAAAYERILYREADQAGLDYYVGELAKGAGYDDVAYSLLRSDEALGDEVAWLYSKYLRRDVDDAGRDYWVGQVRRGFPLRSLVYEIITSQEYMYRYYPDDYRP